MVLPVWPIRRSAETQLFCTPWSKHHSGEFDTELVGELTAGAHQLPRYRMHLPSFLLDEHPDMPIGLEVLRELLFGSTSPAGWCGTLGCLNHLLASVLTP
jgi:hypothetical protein